MDQEQSQEEVKESEAPEVAEETTEVKEVEEQAEKSVAEKVEELAEKAEAPAEEAKPEVTEFTPNYKFKVMDKEHEFDEFLRGVVTTEDHEKKLRELHEKAFGLDVVKTKYQKVRDDHKELEGKYNQLDRGISSLDQMVKRDDFAGFFKNLGIDAEKVYNWAVSRAKYQQAPIEEKHRIDSLQTAQQQAWSNQDQLQELRQQTETQKTDFLQREMDLMFLQPEVKTFEAAYDAKAGKVGAFYDFVKERGETAKVVRQVDYTARQAVDEAIGMLKPFVGLPAAAPTAPQVPGAQATAPAQPKPRVIPNVQGKGNSPVGPPKVKSIDDIKAAYREMVGEN